jgi:acyl carrier protein
MTQLDSDQLHRIQELAGAMSPLGAREAGPDDRMAEDLGYDSLATVELTTALETEFGLDPIDEESAMDVDTVADLVDLVRRSAGAAPWPAPPSPSPR